MEVQRINDAILKSIDNLISNSMVLSFVRLLILIFHQVSRRFILINGGDSIKIKKKKKKKQRDENSKKLEARQNFINAD